MQKYRLENIKIVLLRPFHPGNIGSAARAMKTMGLNRLVLVNPRQFPSDEATKMATSADDILKNALIVDDISEAIGDCSLVIASTARSRGYDLPILSPEKAARLLTQSACNTLKPQMVAIVFGPERTGLINQDMEYATHRVTIPASPDYSSLNLAAAVQTLCYEICKANQLQSERNEATRLLPDAQAMDLFYQHLETTLKETGFINKKHPGEVMKKLKRLFTRAEMDETELNIMRGILSSVERFKR